MRTRPRLAGLLLSDAAYTAPRRGRLSYARVLYGPQGGLIPGRTRIAPGPQAARAARRRAFCAFCGTAGANRPLPASARGAGGASGWGGRGRPHVDVCPLAPEAGDGLAGARQRSAAPHTAPPTALHAPRHPHAPPALRRGCMPRNGRWQGAPTQCVSAALPKRCAGPRSGRRHRLVGRSEGHAWARVFQAVQESPPPAWRPGGLAVAVAVAQPPGRSAGTAARPCAPPKYRAQARWPARMPKTPPVSRAQAGPTEGGQGAVRPMPQLRLRPRKMAGVEPVLQAVLATLETHQLTPPTPPTCLPAP